MRVDAHSAITVPAVAFVSLLALGACNTPAPAPAPPSAVTPGGPAAEPPAEPGAAVAPAARVENGGSGCTPPALPPLEQLPAIESLPDPFLSASGQRITSRAQWTCRRAEISAQVQEYELGPKPPRPSIVTGTVANGELTVTAGEPQRTVSFSVGITRPESASGPVPGLIVIGRSALSPVFASRGAAIITFDNNAMGAQGNHKEGDTYTDTRGQGTFYDLYGKDHPASSMMAWAWGVSRVIDALAATPEAGIDVGKLAVSGCSRNGKGALVVGAFDERIALTVPQESGAGGAASWRISQAQMDEYRATVNPNPPGGQGVQTLLQASGEQPWFRASFGQFGTTPNHVLRLPFDHHMVLGLVAPRALFVIDNTDMKWLGDQSSFTNSVAAAEIWTALGAQAAVGASQVGGHPHCTEVPQAQLDELGAFIDRYLLGTSTADTHVLHSDRVKPDRGRWISWNTPVLK
jgi:hypothetical protein